jgi:hypothetical protein
MARVNWWGFLTETAGLTLGLEQAQDVVNLDCRWVSGVVCGDGGMLVGLRVSKISISKIPPFMICWSAA